MESTRNSVKVRMSEARASQSKVLSNAKPKSCEEKECKWKPVRTIASDYYRFVRPCGTFYGRSFSGQGIDFYSIFLRRPSFLQACLKAQSSLSHMLLALISQGFFCAVWVKRKFPHLGDACFIKRCHGVNIRGESLSIQIWNAKQQSFWYPQPLWIDGHWGEM